MGEFSGLYKGIQFSSVTQSCQTLCNPMDCSMPGLPVRPPITNSQSLRKLKSIETVMPSNYRILCCPLLLPPSIPPSIRVFTNRVSSSHQVAKVLGGFKMTFKFLDWVSKLGKWLDWLGVYPQRGCRKREASFRDYVNYLHLCSC